MPLPRFTWQQIQPKKPYDNKQNWLVIVHVKRKYVLQDAVGRKLPKHFGWIYTGHPMQKRWYVAEDACCHIIYLLGF